MVSFFEQLIIRHQTDTTKYTIFVLTDIEAWSRGLYDISYFGFSYWSNNWIMQYSNISFMPNTQLVLDHPNDFKHYDIACRVTPNVSVSYFSPIMLPIPHYHTLSTIRYCLWLRRQIHCSEFYETTHEKFSHLKQPHYMSAMRLNCRFIQINVPAIGAFRYKMRKHKKIMWWWLTGGAIFCQSAETYLYCMT